MDITDIRITDLAQEPVHAWVSHIVEAAAAIGRADDAGAIDRLRDFLTAPRTIMDAEEANALEEDIIQLYRRVVRGGMDDLRLEHQRFAKQFDRFQESGTIVIEDSWGELSLRNPPEMTLTDEELFGVYPDIAAAAQQLTWRASGHVATFSSPFVQTHLDGLRSLAEEIDRIGLKHPVEARRTLHRINKRLLLIERLLHTPPDAIPQEAIEAIEAIGLALSDETVFVGDEAPIKMLYQVIKQSITEKHFDADLMRAIIEARLRILEGHPDGPLVDPMHVIDPVNDDPRLNQQHIEHLVTELRTVVERYRAEGRHMPLEDFATTAIGPSPNSRSRAEFIRRGVERVEDTAFWLGVDVVEEYLRSETPRNALLALELFEFSHSYAKAILLTAAFRRKMGRESVLFAQTIVPTILESFINDYRISWLIQQFEARRSEKKEANLPSEIVERIPEQLPPWQAAGQAIHLEFGGGMQPHGLLLAHRNPEGILLSIDPSLQHIISHPNHPFPPPPNFERLHGYAEELVPFGPFAESAVAVAPHPDNAPFMLLAGLLTVRPGGTVDFYMAPGETGLQELARALGHITETRRIATGDDDFPMSTSFRQAREVERLRIRIMDDTPPVGGSPSGGERQRPPGGGSAPGMASSSGAADARGASLFAGFAEEGTTESVDASTWLILLGGEESTALDTTAIDGTTPPPPAKGAAPAANATARPIAPK